MVNYHINSLERSYRGQIWCRSGHYNTQTMSFVQSFCIQTLRKLSCLFICLFIIIIIIIVMFQLYRMYFFKKWDFSLVIFQLGPLPLHYAQWYTVHQTSWSFDFLDGISLGFQVWEMIIKEMVILTTNNNNNNNYLGGGSVIRVWDQEVCSLCGLRFEPCGCSYDGHWRLTWSLTSGPVGLVEVRAS
jgi:hypothetical protein